MNTIISKDIDAAVAHLSNDDVVAIPTETVYGLAANALIPSAVAKIFEAKNRPTFNPLIVHCASWDEAKKYVEIIPEKLQILITAFSPGPITFLLKKNNLIPDIVTAGSDYVAIRIPNHPTALSLLQKINFPIAAPSANQFGYISPTTAQHVLDSLNGKIPFILDGSSATVGLESTIVGMAENNQIIVYRLGSITVEQIQSVTNESVIIKNKKEENPTTAGQLKSHYAPNTKLLIGDINKLVLQHQNKNIYSINFINIFDCLPTNHQFVLSKKANLAEAAQNLFSVLRKIDGLGADLILAEKFPDEGIGMAINDRLERASAIK